MMRIEKPHLHWSMLVVALTTACGGDGGTDPVRVTDIEIGDAPRAIEVGASVQLSATATDADGTPVASPGLTWTTSNASVASVSATGLVTGAGAGEATITASADGASANVTLAVRETGPLPAELTGEIRRINVEVPAGTEHTVTADVVIFADASIDIAGTIRIAPGASLSLLADSAITIDGTVAAVANLPVADVSRTQTAGRHGIDATHGINALLAADADVSRFHGEDLLISGPRISIGTGQQNEPATISPAGHVLIVGGGPGFQGPRSFTVGAIGEVRAGPGEDATSAAEDGGPGHFVLLGTPAALQAAAEVSGQATFGFNTVSINGDLLMAGRVYGGEGGKGFSIRTFAEATDQGASATALATHGGAGGNVEVQASQSVNLAGISPMRGGRGGNGGSVGDASTALIVPDGNFDVLKGKSFTARTGNGGKGGDVLIAAPIVTGETFRSNGGNAGGISVTGGDGGGGASGGDFTITVGLPGAMGAGDAILLPTYVEPFFVIENAMNGDDATSPVTRGGNGGRLAVTRGLVSLPTGVEELDRPTNAITRISSGGAGFNGCAVVPQTTGTNGGDAGNMLLPPSLSSAPTMSHVGGKGGDGTTPGTGGSPGLNEVENEPIGSKGADGAACGTLVEAVRLDQPLGMIFTAGSAIELSRITGYTIIDPEAGCSDRHLHGTITIDGEGPFNDPNPSGCGFGPIILVPGSRPKP